MVRKIYTETLKLLLFLVLLLLLPISILAADKNTSTEKRQLIFLLDASKSMQNTGQWMDAADSACMIAAALPEGYEAALLVYNTEIIYEEDFGNISQKTRHALETIELQGYTAPAAALEKAAAMFDRTAAEKRVIFISDGEISLREQSSTEAAIEQFEVAAAEAAECGIRIDTFIIPNTATENKISYGVKETSGKQYIVSENQTMETAAVNYLFQILQIEKTELGGAFAGEGAVTVDLQDIYMQNVKLLLVSEESIKELHAAGQCESLNMLQGNKTAVVVLKNPLEQNVTINYSLKDRSNVHIYLIKEYFLEADIERSDTSENGAFALQVNVLNHKGKSVLDSQILKDSISFYVDGEKAFYNVEDKTAVILYETDGTAGVTVEIAVQPSGNVIHYLKKTDTVELTALDATQEPNNMVLWLVIAALSAVILLLSVLYKGKRKKT